jgi:hypothetical protein
MDEHKIPLEYANSLIYELEKAFYDERGKGARFRMTTVGREFFQKKVLPSIQAPDIDHILPVIGQVLKDEGIITEVSYSREERLIRVQVQGCIHRPVEEHMIACGIEPLACLPANLMVLAIEEKLDLPVELAEIRVENGICSLMLIVFDQRPSLD